MFLRDFFTKITDTVAKPLPCCKKIKKQQNHTDIFNDFELLQVNDIQKNYIYSFFEAYPQLGPFCEYFERIVTLTDLPEDEVINIVKSVNLYVIISSYIHSYKCKPVRVEIIRYVDLNIERTRLVYVKTFIRDENDQEINKIHIIRTLKTVIW
jgi:hypothetical protein